MITRDRSQNEAEELVRREIQFRRQVERDIEAEIDAYHQRMEETFLGIERDRGPITVLTEGDSWFRYTVGRAIPTQLNFRPGFEVLNLAEPGDKVSNMVSNKQLKRLIREFRTGPVPGRDYDAFLFSGGGNDLLSDDRFRCWLHDYEEGMTAEQLLNRDALDCIFGVIRNGYEEIIGIRNQHSPKTRMYLHPYDYAIPSDKGVCGRGPWMNPSLEIRGVPEPLRPEVARIFIDKFAALLDEIASNADGVTRINSLGTLKHSDWGNEIHPTDPGFGKIADIFAAAIGRDVRR